MPDQVESLPTENALRALRKYVTTRRRFWPRRDIRSAQAAIAAATIQHESLDNDKKIKILQEIKASIDAEYRSAIYRKMKPSKLSKTLDQAIQSLREEALPLELAHQNQNESIASWRNHYKDSHGSNERDKESAYIIKLELRLSTIFNDSTAPDSSASAASAEKESPGKEILDLWPNYLGENFALVEEGNQASSSLDFNKLFGATARDTKHFLPWINNAMDRWRNMYSAIKIVQYQQKQMAETARVEALNNYDVPPKLGKELKKKLDKDLIEMIEDMELIVSYIQLATMPSTNLNFDSALGFLQTLLNRIENIRKEYASKKPVIKLNEFLDAYMEFYGNCLQYISAKRQLAVTTNTVTTAIATVSSECLQHAKEEGTSLATEDEWLNKVLCILHHHAPSASSSRDEDPSTMLEKDVQGELAGSIKAKDSFRSVNPATIQRSLQLLFANKDPWMALEICSDKQKEDFSSVLVNTLQQTLMAEKVAPDIVTDNMFSLTSGEARHTEPNMQSQNQFWDERNKGAGYMWLEAKKANHTNSGRLWRTINDSKDHINLFNLSADGAKIDENCFKTLLGVEGIDRPKKEARTYDNKYIATLLYLKIKQNIKDLQARPTFGENSPTWAQLLAHCNKSLADLEHYRARLGELLRLMISDSVMSGTMFKDGLIEDITTLTQFGINPLTEKLKSVKKNLYDQIGVNRGGIFDPLLLTELIKHTSSPDGGASSSEDASRQRGADQFNCYWQALKEHDTPAVAVTPDPSRSSESRSAPRKVKGYALSIFRPSTKRAAAVAPNPSPP